MKNKIKILHLIDFLRLGGGEKNLFNLIQAIDQSKYENHVGYSQGGEFEKIFLDKRITLYKYSEKHQKLKNPANFLILIKIIRYIIVNKINLVHSHTFNAHVLGTIASKLTGISVIEHVHDLRYVEPSECKRRKNSDKHSLYTNYFAFVIRCFLRADALVVLTQGNVDYIKKYKLNLPHRIRRISNGIFLDGHFPLYGKTTDGIKKKFNIPKRSSVILGFGRLSAEKNFDLIIRIAPDILKQCPNAFFIIAGDGPMTDQLKNLCKQNNLSSKMLFPGYCSNIDELLSITDIFLFPSLLELHSLAILETMSMKVPLIVSKGVGNHDEFVKNWGNGILLDPFSDEGWARAVIKLLENKNLRDKIGQNGYKTCFEQFNIKDIAKRFESLYDELIHE